MLQRDRPIPVWGWAEPLSRIRIRLAGHEAICVSNDHGDFLARLPPIPAGGPHVLTVASLASGETVTVRDLLVGEVWLASGQSNMQWTLEQCLPLSEADIADATFPSIRIFNVERRSHLGPHRSCGGRWVPVARETAPGFSAVAYSFARRLHRELGVPVGIITSAWGGTIIQAWTSRSTLAMDPACAESLASYDRAAWTPERWKKLPNTGTENRIADYPADPGNTGENQGWHLPAADDGAGWASIQLPSKWQSAGYHHTGVFWFRRVVEIPSAWIGRELGLYLGAADKQDVTYVNGTKVGRTGEGFEERHWDKPRFYRVPGSLVTGRHLVIAVRVYSFAYDGGLIGPVSAMRVQLAEAPAEAVPIAGEWRMRCEHNLGVVGAAHVPGHGEPNSPHMLFDNMIRPLAPYALRGAIWYQGESNTDTAHHYSRFLGNLVEDWRRHWERLDLAFHVVQLPLFKAAQDHEPDSVWARLREAQAAVLALPHTGFAIALDVGDPSDIHPKNKAPVGERLAQSALVRTYGRAGPPCGPLLRRVLFEGGVARCEFSDAADGLITLDGAAPRPVVLAGENRVFYLAEAYLESGALVARCAQVPRPVARRPLPNSAYTPACERPSIRESFRHEKDGTNPGLGIQKMDTK